MRVAIKGCQRCGEDHVMLFDQLINAANEWNFFSVCPATKQPVLLRVDPSDIPTFDKPKETPE